MQVFLETERLTLRQFTEDDADNLVELDGDPDVMRYLSGGPATPREEIENDILPHFLNYYTRFEAFGFWAAIEKSSGDFLGWFHFRPQEGREENGVELGYRLRKSAWGKGYATEGSLALIDLGFRELGVERVYAGTYEENIGSRRVMEKSGLKFVRSYRFTTEDLQAMGIDPDTFPADEFPGEEVEYALIREDWERRRASEA